MSEIAKNIKKIKSTLPEEVVLVAVSKTKPLSDIQEAYNAGQRDFGENKVQELLAKADVLPKDIRWHMIGHLQSKKVKSIIPHTHLIHGVDSIKLLSEIDKRAVQEKIIVDVLLQVHIAEEQSKFGFDPDELALQIHSGLLNDYPNVKVRGLMGMATFTDNMEQVEDEFRVLKNLYEVLNRDIPALKFDTLSMGMSGDYPVAVRVGSNMVRVGSSIFGGRN